MKIFFYLALISLAQAQNLTPEEQAKLIEENKMLKAKLEQTQIDPEKSKEIMGKLQKFQLQQREQNKYLEELEKEE